MCAMYVYMCFGMLYVYGVFMHACVYVCVWYICAYGVCLCVCVCVYICTHICLYCDPGLYLENVRGGGVTVGISFTTGRSGQLGPEGLPYSALWDSGPVV